MRRLIALGFVLGLTAASVAGVAIGLAAAIAAERMRGLLGEAEWSVEDD